MGKAYGFFEIPSVTAAVVAVDIMCKTADVQFHGRKNLVEDLSRS